MIFPLLGLAEDAEDYELDSDYTQTVNQTYTLAARSFLRKEWPSLLCICRPSSRTYKLPTWPPVLTQQLKHPLSLMTLLEPGNGPLYSASAGALNPIFSPEGPCPQFLLVSAIIYDRVEVVPREILYEHGKESITDLAKLSTDLCKAHGTAYTSPEEKHDAIAKMIICDT